jgi:ferredoxin
VARKVRVWVDPQVCVGNAMCESFAPKTFRLNDNRQSEVFNPEGNSVENILEAAENCPVSAIFVEDAETGERLFP